MDNLLTPLELKVMNILWRLKKAVVWDIINNWSEEPKPAYQTVSTIIRILDESNPKGKAYIGHRSFGRTHQYFPLISKAEYQKRLLGNIIENAFSGSASSLLSALVDNEKLSDETLDGIQDYINKSKD
jgi:BlaI family penicillinase repressor